MSAMREVAVPLRREYGVPLADGFIRRLAVSIAFITSGPYKDLEHYEQKKEGVYTTPDG
ncbi:MAG: hypothetical protein Ct9H300mP19_19990 [Dehalococcoidia bacterium]|nr:MAG: hypothetical protein Ct9H300mP19_19990 [Dehalococcoidia bacterium]